MESKLENSRRDLLDLSARNRLINTPRSQKRSSRLDIVDELTEIGEAHGVEAAQVALAWLLTRPAVASLVVGGRSADQFERNFRAVDLTLSEEELTRLNDVSRLPLLYPYWHQHNFARPRFSPADQALHADYPDRHYGGEDGLI